MHSSILPVPECEDSLLVFGAISLVNAKSRMLSLIRFTNTVQYSIDALTMCN